jgi:hypothetical protein
MKRLLQSALCACLCVTAQAGEITLTVNQQEGHGVTILSDQVSIGTNEGAEVTSIFGTYGGISLYVIKNGITNGLSASSTLPLANPVAVAGPATLRLVIDQAVGFSGYCFCTVKIKPDGFPPDKTVIIPQGTPGANIIMEQSSDLVHWTNSVPGLYTNTAVSSLFFRLRADRL